MQHAPGSTRLVHEARDAGRDDGIHIRCMVPDPANGRFRKRFWKEAVLFEEVTSLGEKPQINVIAAKGYGQAGRREIVGKPIPPIRRRIGRVDADARRAHRAQRINKCFWGRYAARPDPCLQSGAERQRVIIGSQAKRRPVGPDKRHKIGAGSGQGRGGLQNGLLDCLRRARALRGRRAPPTPPTSPTAPWTGTPTVPPTPAR